MPWRKTACATTICTPRAVLAHPLLHHDRAQPSLQRHGVHYRGLNRFSRFERQYPLENGLLSEILLENGYNTYAIGKCT